MTRRLTVLLMLLAFAGTFVVAGCGGSSSNSGSNGASGSAGSGQGGY